MYYQATFSLENKHGSTFPCNYNLDVLVTPTITI
jgi:hypothetical protein